MLALLARTAAEFDKQLRTTLPGEPERERDRAQVGNALFPQLLVGMKGERTGVNALLMGLIALITIVLATLATLVLMQMMFLPYHHLRITWWHRGIVVADLVLIVMMTYRCFFPRGIGKAPLVLGALNRKPRWVTAMAFCVLLAGALGPLTHWLSLSQGRWAGEPRPLFSEWRSWIGQPLLYATDDPDFAATKDGVVFGWFPDRLKLSDETIVGKEKLEKTKDEILSRGGKDFVPTIKLDGRAVLIGADLRGVSLNGAAIQGAYLSQGRLNGARLVEANLQGANLVGAQLLGVYLTSARLQGADIRFAQLLGTNLKGAGLSGALGGAFAGRRPRAAQLGGADPPSRAVAGCRPRGRRLTGANLESAQLEDAYSASRICVARTSGEHNY